MSDAKWKIKLLRALERGRLSKAERYAVAIASCPPSIHLALSSPDLTSVGLTEAWRLFRQRIQRSPRAPDHLVYFAAPAKSSGPAGYHLHCLLWAPYLRLDVVRGHAIGSGFGHHAWIKAVGDAPSDPLAVATYVVGQREQVFGEKRENNIARERCKRSFLYPQRKTLQEHQPLLLHALDLAKSKSVSDRDLVSRLPLFTGVNGQNTRREQSRLRTQSVSPCLVDHA